MTEYTTSSDAVREYLTAQERTARWVNAHLPNGASAEFLSPSHPPSILDDSDAPSYGPDSDNESSHSLPPRMVLHYGGGKPDIPISTDYGGSHSRTGSKTHVATHRRSKSGSHVQDRQSKTSKTQVPFTQSVSYDPSHPTNSPPVEDPYTPPHSPENIIILPSRQESEAQQPTREGSQAAQSPSHNSPSDSRSHSQSPLGAPGSLSLQGELPPLPQQIPNAAERASHSPSYNGSQQDVVAPSPMRAFDQTRVPLPVGLPPMVYSHSRSPSHPHAPPTSYVSSARSATAQSQLPYAYHPPAIVYAPSSKHSKSHYSPPAIVYSPSATQAPRSREAPTIAYSHSAPVPQLSHRPRYGSTPYHSMHSSPTIAEEPALVPYGRSYSSGRSASRDARTPATSVMYVPADPRPRSRPSRDSSPSDDESERGSRTSGSTYYVLPTPGQKVKIVVPHAASIYTATSTTKSAHSPQSAHSGSKRPFFQRIFSIPKLPGSLVSTESRGGMGKRMSRRHTVSEAHLQASMGVPHR
ncbi:uncharacterized protein LAESUDRAFT_731611 [Laetiporus sulphureus 93-53]|uniref:Uncharacterized protein n=1 Tax=Laetiporus sulphureus 93-53 TaxID=1314785 RepID=A0A165BGV8_9APHY|nr:uncharacterized protein LAESUDRAFT_731611 [Laetiporus sulphureus 93-53]KZT01030.1 hypothetical protein LAESUDRAFT_731611 [Laetiporus sulphureus 93-53]